MSSSASDSLMNVLDSITRMENKRLMMTHANQQAHIEHGLQCSINEAIEMLGERKTRQHINQILGSRE